MGGAGGAGWRGTVRAGRSDAGGEGCGSEGGRGDGDGRDGGGGEGGGGEGVGGRPAGGRAGGGRGDSLARSAPAGRCMYVCRAPRSRAARPSPLALDGSDERTNERAREGVRE